MRKSRTGGAIATYVSAPLSELCGADLGRRVTFTYEGREFIGTLDGINATRWPYGGARYRVEVVEDQRGGTRQNWSFSGLAGDTPILIEATLS